MFGSQCIVVAIDAKKLPGKKAWEVFTHGGRKRTGLDAVAWARKAEALGAGEILLTSMDCDGVKNGYDLELTKAVSSEVRIPVIASGGAGKKEDFKDAYNAGASGLLAASLFHYRELEIGELKAYLKRAKVPVRT
jgi:cyclase